MKLCKGVNGMNNINSIKNFSLINDSLTKYMDVTNNGIIIIDINGVIIYHNMWAIKYNNLPYTDLIGKNINEIFPNSDLYRSMITKREEKDDIKMYYGRRLMCDRIPLFDEQGNSYGAYSVFKDVDYLQNDEMKLRIKLVEKGYTAKYNFYNIDTNDSKLISLIEQAKVYSKTSSPILIQGESGTGKELFAQSIHNYSARFDKPFVAFNCTTLTESILESELFGYSDGSFTGAKKGGKIGLFQQAHKGTLLLDEIGEMPLLFQAKLLRVLQEKEIRPIGSDRVVPVDVRIIAATNRCLKEMVTKGLFRLDLMYRLNVLNIKIPPLRERIEDIEIIGRNILKRNYPIEYNKYNKEISEAFCLIKSHSFLGNVRELENIMERLIIILKENNPKINIRNVINHIFDDYPSNELSASKTLNNTNKLDQDNKTLSIKQTLQAIEKEEIERLLLLFKGSKTKVANHMNISISTLHRRIVKYNIV